MNHENREKAIRQSNRFARFIPILIDQTALRLKAVNFVDNLCYRLTVRAFKAVKDEKQFPLMRCYGFTYNEALNGEDRDGFSAVAVKESDFFAELHAVFAAFLTEEKMGELIASYDETSKRFAFAFPREVMREGFRQANKVTRKMDGVSLTEDTDKAERILETKAEKIAFETMDGLQGRQSKLSQLMARFPDKAKRFETFLQSCQGDVSTWPKNWRRNVKGWQRFASGKNSPLFKTVKGRKPKLTV